MGTYHFTEDNTSNFGMNLAAKPSNYLDRQSPVLWGWTVLVGLDKGEQSCGGIRSPGSRDHWFPLFTPAHSIKSQYFPKIPTCYHEKGKKKSLCSEKS